MPISETGGAGWRDVLGALALFLGLPTACLICILGRALRDFLRQRHLDRLEAESLRDEGYPPPGPPTT